jgi:hypothetical protein
MLSLLARITFPAALLYVAKLARDNALAAPDTGDLLNATYVGLCVVLPIGTAIAWAPFFGARLADPLTGVYTEGEYRESRRPLLRLIRVAEQRGHRQRAAWLCFLEGINRPWQPTAFVIGLRNARPGSWLERVFAKEVYRFDNAQNCLAAYQVPERHGVRVRPHRRAEVNLLIQEHQRAPRRAAETMTLPLALPPPPPKRNPRIRLFEAADRKSEG